MSNRMGSGLLLALVGLLVLTGLYSPVGAQPNFTTILVDDNVHHGSTSIAFDSRGHPHIAYYDSTIAGTFDNVWTNIVQALYLPLIIK